MELLGGVCKIGAPERRLCSRNSFFHLKYKILHERLFGRKTIFFNGVLTTFRKRPR